MVKQGRMSTLLSIFYAVLWVSIIVAMALSIPAVILLALVI